jgi:hypothetical protein
MEHVSTAEAWLPTWLGLGRGLSTLLPRPPGLFPEPRFGRACPMSRGLGRSGVLRSTARPMSLGLGRSGPLPPETAFLMASKGLGKPPPVKASFACTVGTDSPLSHLQNLVYLLTLRAAVHACICAPSRETPLPLPTSPQRRCETRCTAFGYTTRW